MGGIGEWTFGSAVDIIISPVVDNVIAGLVVTISDPINRINVNFSEAAGDFQYSCRIIQSYQPVLHTFSSIFITFQ